VDAVRRALRRAGAEGTVREQAVSAGVRTLEFRPSSTPRVVIVIPTRDGADLLRRCLDSLRRSTQYPDYHIVVVDNQSVDPDLFELLDENLGRKAFSVVHYDRPFNHSEIHNQVLADVDAEFAVLLNNDVVDFSPGWLEQLVAVAQLSTTIAGVGGMLLYPDGRVQHGGVIVDVDAVAAHAHVDLPVEDGGYADRLHCLQEMSACTAACLLLRLQAFHEVGGFDAVQFPTSFNDVDLWLRLRERGYRCVYQPLVRATHYESASRGPVHGNWEAARCLQERLRARNYCDPFHHPQLTAIPQPFSDRMRPVQAERERLLRLIAGEKPDRQAARRAA
jgi:GT2 family glycosyltransferase